MSTAGIVGIVVIAVVLAIGLAVFMVNVRRHHPEDTALHDQEPHLKADRPADAGAEPMLVEDRGRAVPGTPDQDTGPAPG